MSVVIKHLLHLRHQGHAHENMQIKPNSLRRVESGVFAYDMSCVAETDEDGLDGVSSNFSIT